MNTYENSIQIDNLFIQFLNLATQVKDNFINEYIFLLMCVEMSEKFNTFCKLVYNKTNENYVFIANSQGFSVTFYFNTPFDESLNIEITDSDPNPTVTFYIPIISIK